MDKREKEALGVACIFSYSVILGGIMGWGVGASTMRNNRSTIIKDLDGDGIDDQVLANGTELIRRGDQYFTPQQLRSEAEKNALASLDRFGNKIEYVRNPWDSIDYRVRKDQISCIDYNLRRTQSR